MTPAAILLRRTLVPLAGMAVVAGFVTAWITMRSSPGVEATLTFTIYPPEQALLRREEGGRSADTSFEILRAADLFTETVTGWLSGPDFVADVYQRARVEFPDVSIARLSRAFAAQKRGGHVAAVRFHARSPEEARALATAATAELAERTEAFNREARSLSLHVAPSEPLIVPVRLSPAIRGATAGLVVFVLALNAVLLWDFVRTSPDVTPDGHPGTPVS